MAGLSDLTGGSMAFSDFFSPDLLKRAAHDEAGRLLRIRHAWDAYYGQHPDSIKVTYKPGQQTQAPDDNAIRNYCRLIVDVGVTYLFGKGHTIEVDHGETASNEPQPDQTTPEDEWLEGFLEQNDGDLLWQKCSLNGGVCGHVFARLYPTPEGSEYPRVQVLDPGNVDVTWDPDDFETVWEYRVQWDTVDPATGQGLTRRHRIQWNHETGDASAWMIIEEEDRSGAATPDNSWFETGREPWPYPFAPVVDCQNLPAPNEYWGMADLEPDIIDLNLDINRAKSWMKRILRLFSHPHLVGTGMEASTVIDLAPDRLTRLPEGATLEVLKLEVDLVAAKSWLDDSKDELHELSQVPYVATGKLDSIGTAQSGVALRILYGPLVDKTEKKQPSYEKLVCEVIRRAALLDQVDLDVVINWSDLIPSDPFAEAQLLLMDEQLGVSKATLQEKRGYDPVVEAQKSQAEAESAAANAQAMFDRGGGPGGQQYNSEVAPTAPEVPPGRDTQRGIQ